MLRSADALWPRIKLAPSRRIRKTGILSSAFAKELLCLETERTFLIPAGVEPAFPT
jgi:hypothetical protein